MKYLITFISFFCTFSLQCAEVKRGVVMAAADKYMHYALPSIAFLRLHQKSDIPIEIWHAGNELSDDSKRLLQLFQPIEIKDISLYYDKEPEFFRGFQIKGFVGEATSFDEFILMDADVFLYMKPELLFELQSYKKSGAFFFRDRNKFWKPESDNELFLARQKFITHLVPEPSENLPSDWKFYWTENCLKQNSRHSHHHMDSGVVVINKKRHRCAISNVRELNENHERVYQFVYGDKETFWIGFEKAKEMYSVNESSVRALVTNHFYTSYDPLFASFRSHNRMMHFVENTLCFQQKVPVAVSHSSFLANSESLRKKYRALSEKELKLIQAARLYYEIFHKCDKLLSTNTTRTNFGGR